jgi:hypothetical protein
MLRTSLSLAPLLLAASFLAASGAHAAGGHHAVDDASVLQGGDCEQETWASHAPRGERLLHAGLNCGVGPIEIGAAADYARGDGESATAWVVEAKWAASVTEGFSVGLDLQPVWVARRAPRLAGARVSALATWTPSPVVALHFNTGRDFVQGDRDLPNGGIAAEWAARPDWTLLLERYRDFETHFVRAGARWAVHERWSLDLSHAHRMAGPLPSYWTLGVTLALDD